MLGGAQGFTSLFKKLDFSTGALGKANDFWGSFTGTSASTFLEAGQKSVQKAQNILQTTLESNPSKALTTYSQTLWDEWARFSNASSNSSQSKTRKGNAKSVSDVKNAIDNIPALITQLETSYHITSRSKSGSRTDFGKYTKRYAFKIYTLSKRKNVKKEVTQTEQNNTSTASTSTASAPVQNQASMGFLAVIILLLVSRNKSKSKGFF